MYYHIGSWGLIVIIETLAVFTELLWLKQALFDPDSCFQREEKLQTNKATKSKGEIVHCSDYFFFLAC